MRPYRQFKIGDLEREFDKHRNDPEKCEFIARELSARKKTVRVRDLHERVVQRIAVGFKEDQDIPPLRTVTSDEQPSGGWLGRLLDRLGFKSPR
jgi:hypothetical protein